MLEVVSVVVATEEKKKIWGAEWLGEEKSQGVPVVVTKSTKLRKRYVSGRGKKKRKEK